LKNPYLFTGRRFDEESDLYYYRNRMYDARAGRYLSRDPLGFDNDFSFYQFVDGNPVGNRDPYGLLVKCGGVSGAFVFVAGAGLSVYYCWDECGNSGVVLCATARIGADIGAGIGGAGFAGCLKDMVSGKQGGDISVGAGPVAGGVDFDDKANVSGGHGSAGPSALRVGASGGIGACSLLTGSTSKKCPCPPPPPPPKCPPMDSRRYLKCFVAGTPVWTEDGLVAIEEIEIGDQVMAWDEATGEVDYHKVLQLIRSERNDLCRLDFNEGDTVICSRNHRFWIESRGWVEAQNLQLNDVCYQQAGENVKHLQRLEIVATPTLVPVYNIEVESAHTYFVGEQQILVHNWK
ncbi:MAG: hypothetical protein GY869_28995, partial [Planctomycetes bacterium]|nr:hypothetical protein [Planctomycetota bacterium]